MFVSYTISEKYISRLEDQFSREILIRKLLDEIFDLESANLIVRESSKTNARMIVKI